MPKAVTRPPIIIMALMLVELLSFYACNNDTSQTPEIAQCNNQNLEEGEECDGTLFTYSTCAELNLGTGNLSCSSDCHYDTSNCSIQMQYCGNETVEGTEQCEPSITIETTCADLEYGFIEGDLVCDPVTCQYDLVNCSYGGVRCSGPSEYPTFDPLLPDGHPCNFDRDCENNSCITYKFGAFEAKYCSGAEPGRFAQLSPNTPCNFDAECGTGYCWIGSTIRFCSYLCDESWGHDDNFSCQADPYASNATSDSETGFSCQPNPGIGDVGDSCEIADYDCKDNMLCLMENCTRDCNSDNPCPTDSTCELMLGRYNLCIPNQIKQATPNGSPCLDNMFCQSETCLEGLCRKPCTQDGNECSAGEACVQVYAGISICLSGEDINHTEGQECINSAVCLSGLGCILGQCQLLCPNGEDSECAASTIGRTSCAFDHPKGSHCVMSSDTHYIDDGETCSYQYECLPESICLGSYSNKKCQATCETQDDCPTDYQCAEQQNSDGLDTKLWVSTTDGDGWTEYNDDERGTLRLRTSKISHTVSGGETLLIQTEPYSTSSSGAYRLLVYLQDGSQGEFIDEVETGFGINNEPSQAQILTQFPVTVNANYVNTAEKDVDYFTIVLPSSLPAESTLIVRTSSIPLMLCQEIVYAELGEACTLDSECRSGTCFPLALGEGFCVEACENNQSCGDTNNDGQLDQCTQFIGLDGTASYCFPAGEQELSSGLFGSSCDSPHQCQSRLCASRPDINAPTCIAFCPYNSHAGDPCVYSTQTGWLGECIFYNEEFGMICLPHGSGQQLAGQPCLLDRDCQSGNCISNVCAEVATGAQYQIDPLDLGTLGQPCNFDSDCQTNLECNKYYFCDQPGEDGVWNNIKVNLGLPCYTDEHCTSGFCYHDGKAYYCVEECTDQSACSERIFDQITGCYQTEQLTPSSDHRYACLPNRGTNNTGEPCWASWLDCATGFCYWSNESIEHGWCAATCSLTNPGCGSEARCVNYPSDKAPMVDTEIFVYDSPTLQNRICQGNQEDDIYWAGFEEPATITWSRSICEQVDGQSLYVLIDRSEYWDIVDPDYYQVGDYTFTVYSNLRPLPVTYISAENENNPWQWATPAMSIEANFQTLAGRQDRDGYTIAVAENDGEALVIQTGPPLEHICWPNFRLEKEQNQACEYSFECLSGYCKNYCMTDCTFNESLCPADTSCREIAYNRITDYRKHCVRDIKWGQNCYFDNPECDLCYPRFADSSIGQCWSECTTQGATCEGDGTCYSVIIDYGSYTENKLVCIPPGTSQQTEGAPCLMDSDCMESLQCSSGTCIPQ